MIQARRSIRLRNADATDVTVILAFINDLAEYEKLSHEVVVDEQSLSAWLFGKSPVAEVVIAEIDAEPVGFALFFTSFSTFLGRPGIYLEDLFVRPRHRGLGVGKALLRHLARMALQRNYGRLEWAVLDWNSPAIDFYEGMGAHYLSEWKAYRLSGDALAKFGGSN